jgi:transcriptional regulator NrdR family protein
MQETGICIYTRRQIKTQLEVQADRLGNVVMLVEVNSDEVDFFNFACLRQSVLVI